MALDEEWWERHGPDVVRTFQGECFSVSTLPRDKFGVTYLNPIIRDEPSLDWESPSYGADSGQFAIQIAVLMGCTRILLLGYDMGDGPNGERHWFGDHPQELRNTSPYYLFLEKYGKGAPWFPANGIEVINCSRRTRLECFPRMELADALCGDSGLHGSGGSGLPSPRR